MTTTTTRSGPERETGSVSIWLATASFVMIVLVGLAVDLGGQVYAQQHARNVAAQAARVGGEQVLAAPAVRGLGVQADTGAAKAAAADYLAAADVAGSVTIQGGGTLAVTTTDTYQTKFLSIIGLNSMTVTGRGSARMARAVEGVEQ